MSRKKKRNALLLLGSAAVVSATTYYYLANNRKNEKGSHEVVQLLLKNQRGADMPCLLYRPLTTKKYPLVIFCAGFHDDKTSDGRFTAIAEKLAQKGIASVMMDHAGCGESKEDFLEYSLSNSISDIDTLMSYLLISYPVDRDRMALVGYSMGGRDAVLFARLRREFTTLVLLAPSLGRAYDGATEELFGGVDSYKRLEESAAQNGYIFFEDGNERIKVSDRFFKDLKEYDCLRALEDFKGNILYVQGNKDEVISPEASGRALQYLNKKAKLNYVYLDQTNHTFNQGEKDPTQCERMIGLVSEYLSEKI